MPEARPPLVIASQLGDDYDKVIATALGEDIRLVPVARAQASGIPAEAEALFAFPFRQAGQPLPERPRGWPFNIRWVQILSAGLDPYPDWLFDGPVAASSQGTLAVPIAEFCLAAIFAAAKRMPDVWVDNPGDWRLRPMRSIEGSTLGIYGFGAIGQALATRALALGMRVIAARRSDAPLPDGVERAADIDELLARSDHLVLAAPATDETRHIIDTARLAGARPGLHIVNVARGALIDTAALIAALNDGRVALASLDVAEQEPPPPGDPLYSHPRVRLSPHTSVAVDDMHARAARIFIDNFRRFRAGEELENIIATGELNADR